MDAINQYVYRGQRPTPLPVPTPKRISTPAGQRLSTILESGNSHVTGKSQGFGLANLASLHNERHGEPPRHSDETKPPSYVTQDSMGAVKPEAGGVELPFHTKPSRIRQSRGGWKRLGLIILLVVLVIALALGIGLGVGLRKHTASDSSTDINNNNSSIPQGPFPIGSYAIAAFLTNITTSCTSSNVTWACYPYTTYSSDPANSEAPFNWFITASPLNSSAYQISSSDNPLSILFSNASLILVDEGLSTERYIFSIPNTIKNVVPSQSLTGNNVRSTCFYNSTTFQASLYTRMNATLLDDSTIQTNSGSFFNNTWPGAVMVEQYATGGSDVPNCFPLSNGYPTGDMIPLATEPITTQCKCVYSNFDAS